MVRAIALAVVVVGLFWAETAVAQDPTAEARLKREIELLTEQNASLQSLIDLLKTKNELLSARAAELEKQAEDFQKSIDLFKRQVVLLKEQNELLKEQNDVLKKGRR